MTNAEYIAETLIKYQADVLNILKCPHGQTTMFCKKLGDCTKCKMQWLREKRKDEKKIIEGNFEIEKSNTTEEDGGI